MEMSGKWGTLYVGGRVLAPVGNWEASIEGNLKEYGSNATAGWKENLSGTQRWSGTFLLRADDAGCLIVQAGASYPADFHIGPALLNYIHGCVRISEIRVPVDIDDGAPIEYTVTWVGRLAPVLFGLLDDTCGSGSPSSGC